MWSYDEHSLRVAVYASLLAKTSEGPPSRLSCEGEPERHRLILPVLTKRFIAHHVHLVSGGRDYEPLPTAVVGRMRRRKPRVRRAVGWRAWLQLPKGRGTRG